MRYLDLGVIVAYLIGITIFGARFEENQKSLRDYFLGGRNAPWWAIAFSIVSAETSTLTVIGTPAISFNGNFGFLQVVFGYLLARIVIITLLLPHYFRGEMFTAYELMERRFGPRLRRFTAGSFLALRAMAEGVRVFAISIVISIVLGTGEVWSILLIVILTLFYTFEGGLTAVIWTDVVQMILYVAGAILSLVVIFGKIPGGWEHVMAVAGAKFTVFDFRTDFFAPDFFTRTFSFWAGVIGGCFLTTASHGTEQLMVQRLLAARNEAESRRALLVSWGVIMFQFTLFLLIGVLLYVYYQDGNLAPPNPPDRIYPAFIWNNLPVGVAGLIIAAILAAAMSNLSAALNSLASTTVMDFWRPLSRRSRTDPEWLALAKRSTVAWGAILFGIALVAQGVQSVLQAGLSIASVVYGALLGVFLLGVSTRHVGQRAAMAGMLASLITMIYVKSWTSIAWTWYVVIGSAVTVGVALAVSLFIKEEPVQEHA
ncbi:MAG: sodium/solute symporter [Acidobacteria bacterium]|nr:sodium/solute symporter [Acidobacteriota bacterium]